MSPRQELDQSLMHMFTCPQPDDRHVIGDRRFMWSVKEFFHQESGARLALGRAQLALARCSDM